MLLIDPSSRHGRMDVIWHQCLGNEKNTASRWFTFQEMLTLGELGTVFGAKESHEVRQHKGPSGKETNVPKGHPAATTGHVWGSLQVIQLLGFKLPWHQWEQMGAVQLYHEQITDSWVKQFWCYFKPLSPLVTGISPLQHHFHTILASPHLNLMFLSDHDGKLSSTRSNRAYLQCFPQSHTKRSKTQSLWWFKENHSNEDILWSIILRPRFLGLRDLRSADVVSPPLHR